MKLKLSTIKTSLSIKSNHSSFCYLVNNLLFSPNPARQTSYSEVLVRHSSFYLETATNSALWSPRKLKLRHAYQKYRQFSNTGIYQKKRETSGIQISQSNTFTGDRPDNETSCLQKKYKLQFYLQTDEMWWSSCRWDLCCRVMETTMIWKPANFSLETKFYGKSDLQSLTSSEYYVMQTILHWHFRFVFRHWNNCTLPCTCHLLLPHALRKYLQTEH